MAELNEQYHHAKFDICHIYGVCENPKANVFNKPRHLTISPECTSVSQIILCTIIFNVHSKNTVFKLQWAKIKTTTIQFAVYVSDEPMTLNQDQGHTILTLSKIIIMQSLKATLQMFTKKPTLTFFLKSGNTSTIPLEYLQKSKMLVYT